MRRTRKPNRRSRKGPRGSRPKMTDPGTTVVSISDSYVANFTVTPAVTVVDIDFYPTPVISTRWTSVASNFIYYRIVAFEYWLVPSTTRVSNEMFAHMVMPLEDNASPPGTFGDLMIQPGAKVFDARSVTNQKNKISRKNLLGQAEKWWACKSGSRDYMQIHLMLISNSAIDNSVTIYWKAVVEFKGAAINFLSKEPQSDSDEEEKPTKKALSRRK